MDHVAPEQLQLNVANLAVWAYTIANLPELLPRGNDPAPSPSGSNKPNTQVIVVSVVSAVGGLAVVAAAAAAWVLGRRGRGPLKRCLAGGAAGSDSPGYSRLGKAYTSGSV